MNPIEVTARWVDDSGRDVVKRWFVTGPGEYVRVWADGGYLMNVASNACTGDDCCDHAAPPVPFLSTAQEESNE